MNASRQYPPPIMVVDDNPDILITLRQLFELQKYTVFTVENGRECLRFLENGFQGIIILDLMMPVMDGAETIHHMVVEGLIDNNIVIVLSAKKVQGQEFNEIYPHIFDYVTKPFDLLFFLELIEKAIDQYAKPIKIRIK